MGRERPRVSPRSLVDPGCAQDRRCYFLEGTWADRPRMKKRERKKKSEPP